MTDLVKFTAHGGLDLLSNPQAPGSSVYGVPNPDGLRKADNCIINRPGIVERRRGFDNYSTGLPISKQSGAVNGYPVNQITDCGGQLFAQVDDGYWWYSTAISSWVRLALTNGARIGLIAATALDLVNNRLYLTDTTRYVVRYIDLATGKMVLFCGQDGVSGSADGVGAAASFTAPGLAWFDGVRYLYVADQHAVRRIDTTNATVLTWAGSVATLGNINGTGTASRFNNVGGVWGNSTNLFVVDSTNSVIRQITISGAVSSTFAGTAGTAGTANGTGTGATFTFYFFTSSNSLTGDGTNLYCNDRNNFKIRAITIAGAVVTTPLPSVASDVISIYTDSALSTLILSGIVAAGQLGISTMLKSAGFTVATLTSASYNNFNLASMTGASGGDIIYGAANIGGASNTRAVGAFYRNVADGVARPFLLTSPSVSTFTTLGGQSDFHFTGPYAVASSPTDASGRRMRTAEYNGSSYFTSQLGIQKFVAPSTVTSNTLFVGNVAGAPKALDLTASLSGASGFLATGNSTAYRVLWFVRDTNQNIVFGVPSTRLVVANAAGAGRTVTLTFTVPQTVTDPTASSSALIYGYQVYRAAQTATGIDPGDELGQVYEGTYSGTQSTVTLIDICPDAAIGAPLYTNASQQGASQANEVPPLAADIANFHGCMFYANITYRQRLFVSLIGVAPLSTGSTVTIAGTVLTGSTVSENIATGQFQIFNAGLDSANLSSTVYSIIRVLNGYSSNANVYGFYSSTIDGAPGQFYIEERGIGGAAFTLATSAPTAFYTRGTSTNGYLANGLAYSKQGQPEAVPITNYFRVGPQSEQIQRIVALRDSLIVIKDFSAWRVTGTGPFDFSVALIDDTFAITGRDTVDAMDNSVYCLSNEGVEVIGDNGTGICSRQIEPELLAYVRNAQAFGNINDFVGAGQDSSHQYVVCGPSLPQSELGGRRIAFALNNQTNSWTRWRINAKCIDSFGDRYILGLDKDYNSLQLAGVSGVVSQYGGGILRQKLGYYDGLSQIATYGGAANSSLASLVEMADDFATATLSALPIVGATTLTLNAAISTLSFPNYGTYNAGMTSNAVGQGWCVLGNASGVPVTLELASASGSTLTLAYPCPLALTSSTIALYRPIPMTVEFPVSGESEFNVKVFQELILLIEAQNVQSVGVEFERIENIKGDPVFQDYTSDAFTPAQVLTLLQSFPPAVTFPQTVLKLQGFLQNKYFRTLVPPLVAGSVVCGVRFSQNSALSRFAIKSVGLTVNQTSSTRVVQ